MPNMGSFKESGDIEYSADNAIILQPNWNLLDALSTQERKSTLWLVANLRKSERRERGPPDALSHSNGSPGGWLRARWSGAADR